MGSRSTKIVKGFKCKCGEQHKFPAYVYAHYNDDLVFICPKCQRQYGVMHCHATLEKEP